MEKTIEKTSDIEGDIIDLGVASVETQASQPTGTPEADQYFHTGLIDG